MRFTENKGIRMRYNFLHFFAYFFKFTQKKINGITFVVGCRSVPFLTDPTTFTQKLIVYFLCISLCEAAVFGFGASAAAVVVSEQCGS